MLNTFDYFCRPHVINAHSLNEVLSIYFAHGEMTSMTKDGETRSLTMADGLPFLSTCHTTPFSGSSTFANLSTRHPQLSTDEILLAVCQLLGNGARIGRWYRPNVLIVGEELKTDAQMAVELLPFPLEVQICGQIKDKRWIVADTCGTEFVYRQLTREVAEFGMVHGMWAYCSIPS